MSIFDVEVIQFSREVQKRLVNTEQLPHGTGCKYLEVMQGEGEDLVAVCWRRKLPAKLNPLFKIIKF